MFFTSDQEPGVQLPVLVVYDLSTGAVMAMQSTKDSSVATVGDGLTDNLHVVQESEEFSHSSGFPRNGSQGRCFAQKKGKALH